MQKYNNFLKFQFNVDFFKYIAQRLVAWRQLGIWLAKCIDLRPIRRGGTKPTLIPIAIGSLKTHPSLKERIDEVIAPSC
jgi:hypothetical protein